MSMCVVCLEEAQGSQDVFKCPQCSVCIHTACGIKWREHDQQPLHCPVCSVLWPLDTFTPWVQWRLEWQHLSQCPFDLCPRCGVAVECHSDCGTVECLCCGYHFAFRQTVTLERNEPERYWVERLIQLLISLAVLSFLGIVVCEVSSVDYPGMAPLQNQLLDLQQQYNQLFEASAAQVRQLNQVSEEIRQTRLAIQNGRVVYAFTWLYFQIKDTLFYSMTMTQLKLLLDQILPEPVTVYCHDDGDTYRLRWSDDFEVEPHWPEIKNIIEASFSDDVLCYPDYSPLIHPFANAVSIEISSTTTSLPYPVRQPPVEPESSTQ